ncbi:hypothetical protein [uncultured Thiothrix sp.]|uniref:hypothetical protein n=1 Tax=uncultured Thiothrix sp. TaxID=223185 RepID=UPI0026208EEB|nr:hypothetical protein [uncultured Thiothrix sp.]
MKETQVSAANFEQHEALAINEVQLLLAEKRTSLSILRTGLAVLVLPMTVTSFLIATSSHYQWLNIWYFLLPLMLLNLLLVVLGAYLILHSMKKMLHYDRLIHQLCLEHPVLKHLLNPKP